MSLANILIDKANLQRSFWESLGNSFKGDHIMAIKDYFKGSNFHESIPFSEVKDKILKKFDEKEVSLDFSSFPKAFQEELERAYIDKVAQTKRKHELDRHPEDGKRNEAFITRHYVFKGNPGTGKSSAARLMGFFFKELDILKSNNFSEVSRADLIGDYVGHTETKTRKVLEKSKNGILFINEAHQLMPQGNSKDYGLNAVHEIMKYMEDHRNEIIIIIDGVPKLIEKFLQGREGLRDRFSRHIEFSELTDEQLLNMSKTIMGEYRYKFTLESENKYKELITIIRKKHENNTKSPFANFRTIRNALDLIIEEHNKRLFGIRNLNQEICMKIETVEIENVIHYYRS